MDGTAIDRVLADAAGTVGTPCFVYFLDAIAARITRLADSFDGRFALSFAVKSNPHPGLLRWLAPRVAFLDVSSIGELRAGVLAGWDAARIGFTGPAKRDAELAEAMGLGVGEIILESVREAVTVDRIAATMMRRQRVMIRIAPDRVPRGFGDQMAGRPSPFGIDWEDAAAELPPILALPNLDVVGLHIYSGTQCLKASVVAENYRIFLAIFRTICAEHDLYPEKLVFGSGLGVPYHAEDRPVDLDAVADEIRDALDALLREPRFRKTALVLELGRYLVGEAGYFLTRIVSVKSSRGTRIGICDGGMNNHLPASGHFGMVVRRNYMMHKVGGVGPPESIDLVGPLCTSIDRLAVGVMLPRLEVGDVVAVHASGAYGPTASPLRFISHPLPHEILIGIDGRPHAGMPDG